jgi:transcription elongation GreA/GreB family factor
VARALMGKRMGDEVTVRRPKGEVTFRILTVRYR